MLTFIASSKPPKMNEINGDLRGTSFSHWSNHHAHWTCPPLAMTKNIQPFLEKWVNVSSANSKTSQINNSNMNNRTPWIIITDIVRFTVYKFCSCHSLQLLFMSPFMGDVHVILFTNLLRHAECTVLKTNFHSFRKIFWCNRDTNNADWSLEFNDIIIVRLHSNQ